MVPPFSCTNNLVTYFFIFYIFGWIALRKSTTKVGLLLSLLLIIVFMLISVNTH